MSLFKNKGSRLQSNLIKICQKSNGQFLMTIPSKIALRQSLNHGDIVHIEELFAGGFSVKKVEIIKDGEEIK